MLLMLIPVNNPNVPPKINDSIDLAKYKSLRDFYALTNV